MVAAGQLGQPPEETVLYKTDIVNFGKQSSQKGVSKYWNSLAFEVRESSYYPTFKTGLKRWENNNKINLVTM